MMRIATGEDEDTVVEDGKDPAAKALGARGGKKRVGYVTPELRAEIAEDVAVKNDETKKIVRQKPKIFVR